MIAAGVVRHLVKKEKAFGFSESFYLDRMVANRRIGGRNISVNFLLDARMKQYTIKTTAFEVKCIRGMIKKNHGTSDDSRYGWVKREGFLSRMRSIFVPMKGKKRQYTLMTGVGEYVPLEYIGEPIPVNDNADVTVVYMSLSRGGQIYSRPVSLYDWAGEKEFSLGRLSDLSRFFYGLNGGRILLNTVILSTLMLMSFIQLMAVQSSINFVIMLVVAVFLFFRVKKLWLWWSLRRNLRKMLLNVMQAVRLAPETEDAHASAAGEVATGTSYPVTHERESCSVREIGNRGVLRHGPGRDGS